MCGKSRQVVLKKKGQMCLRKDEKIYKLTLRQLLLPRSIVLTVVSLHLEESISYFFYSPTHSVSPKFKATTTTAPQKVLFSLSVIFLGSRIMLQLWLLAGCCCLCFLWKEEEEEEEEDPKGSFPFSKSGFDGRKEPFLVTMAASLPSVWERERKQPPPPPPPCSFPPQIAQGRRILMENVVVVYCGTFSLFLGKSTSLLVYIFSLFNAQKSLSLKTKLFL